MKKTNFRENHGSNLGYVVWHLLSVIVLEQPSRHQKKGLSNEVKSKANPSPHFFLACRVFAMHQQFSQLCTLLSQSWSQWEHAFSVICRSIPRAGWKSGLGPEASLHPREGWAFACLLLRTQMSQSHGWSDLLGGKFAVLFGPRFTEYLEMEGAHKDQVQLWSEWPKSGLNPKLQGYQHHALTYGVFLHTERVQLGTFLATWASNCISIVSENTESFC